MIAVVKLESIPAEPLGHVISVMHLYVCVHVFSCFWLLVCVLHCCESKYLYSCLIIPPPLAAPLNLWEVAGEKLFHHIRLLK